MSARPFLVKAGALLTVIVGGWMGYQSYQEHQRNATIQKEIDALQAEADKIRRENETLAQRIEYFSSPDFQEQEAKKKLGLRRQEESVMAIRENPSFMKTSPEAAAEGSETRERDPVPYHKKWWRQFFSTEQER